MHRVGEECSQGVALADRLLLVASEQLVELHLLLILGEHLEAVVVVADVLLVDSQHWKQHVKDVCSTSSSKHNHCIISHFISLHAHLCCRYLRKYVRNVVNMYVCVYDCMYLCMNDRCMYVFMYDRCSYVLHITYIHHTYM